MIKTAINTDNIKSRNQAMVVMNADRGRSADVTGHAEADTAKSGAGSLI